MASEEEIERIKESNLFNAEWYTMKYPDVQASGMDAAEHYYHKGWKNNYDPGPDFSTRDYNECNPDVELAEMCPLLHYECYGRNENRPLKRVRNIAPPSDIKGNGNPKFSIIVASYNYASIIGEAIDSLLAQTYRNYEIIVVDDGSPDNSLEVISNYVKQHDCIKLYTHENGVNKGLPSTVRLGISKATGDYIAFCECDDSWTPEHLALLAEMIYDYNNPAIISNHIELFGTVTPAKRGYIAFIDNYMKSNVNNINISSAVFNPVPTFSAVCVRTDILRSLDYDAYIPAWLDWWLWRQVLVNNPLYFIGSRITRHRVHESYNSGERAREYALQTPEFIAANNRLILSRCKVSHGAGCSCFKKIINRFFSGKKSKLYKKIKNSGLFDEAYYTHEYLMDDSSIDPIAHYLTEGWMVNYHPSRKFNTRQYYTEHPEIEPGTVNTLLHYLDHK